MAKYVSYNKLSFFLSKLRTIFSDINHTHTVVHIENLQNTLDTMSSDMDALTKTIVNLDEKANEKELPEVTVDDNGAFLRVVNWIWTTEIILNAEEASF